MKKIFLSTCLLLGATTVFGQRGVKPPKPPTDSSLIIPNDSLPGWNGYKLSAEDSKHTLNQAKTASCNEILHYTKEKDARLGNINHLADGFGAVSLYQDTEDKLSQTFLNNAPITLPAVMVLCANDVALGSPASGIEIKVSVYAVDDDNKPTTLIGSGTKWIYNSWDNEYNYHNVVFGTPINVTANYAIVVETETTDGVLAMCVNKMGVNVPYHENLSHHFTTYTVGTTPNVWTKVSNNVADFSTSPPTYIDTEPIVAPYVTYTINADATVPATGTKDVSLTFTNTSDITALNRMTSSKMFNNHWNSLLADDYSQDLTFVWTPTGDASDETHVKDLVHTYTNAATYTPKLTVVGGFENECKDTKDFSITIEEPTTPPLDPCEIKGDITVCVGKTITLTPSVTGGTWGVDKENVIELNETTGVVKGLAAGIVQVTYKSNGCSGEDTHPITVTTCNETTGVEDMDVFANIIVAPNPTANNLVVTGLPEQSTIIISDLNGKILLVQNSTNTQETLSLENCVNGVYLLHIQSEQINGTRKIVLNK